MNEGDLFCNADGFFLLLNSTVWSIKSSPFNGWNWTVNWDLPINTTIRRAPPLQLSLATASRGKDLGFLMDNSFSPSIHWKETVFKARHTSFYVWFHIMNSRIQVNLERRRRPYRHIECYLINSDGHVKYNKGRALLSKTHKHQHS